MREEELAYVCQEAARELAAREPRPLPPTLILPDPRATRLIRIPDFPADDERRALVLDQLAREEILDASRPAWGFVAEADLADGTDAVVAVYGAHGLPPSITAAPVATDGTLGDFSDPEPLDPEALPFLHPLQHAAEEVHEPPDAPGVPDFG
jgi:hypothetical protein